MKPNIFEESYFYPENFSHSRHFLLFQTVILKEKKFVECPWQEPSFNFECGRGKWKMENAADNFTRKELKLSWYDE